MILCFSTYEGDVVKGLRHGFGVLHSVSLRMTYSGEWVLGKQHGKVSVLYEAFSHFNLEKHFYSSHATFLT